MSKNRLENFKGKRGVNGLDKNPQNINRKGRKLGMKSQLLKELNSGGTMTINAKDVIEVKPNGDVITRTTTAHALVKRLIKLANDKNPNAALNAIKLIMEKTDGNIINQIIRDTDEHPKSLMQYYRVDMRKIQNTTMQELIWFAQSKPQDPNLLSRESLIDWFECSENIPKDEY